MGVEYSQSYAGPRAPGGSVTRNRRCSYRPSVRCCRGNRSLQYRHFIISDCSTPSAHHHPSPLTGQMLIISDCYDAQGNYLPTQPSTTRESHASTPLPPFVLLSLLLLFLVPIFSPSHLLGKALVLCPRLTLRRDPESSWASSCTSLSPSLLGKGLRPPCPPHTHTS